PIQNMRGCCGRELGREFWTRDLDGGNNSSSLISGSGSCEVRLRAVAAHARVMILWPFYN
ncbi:hypothetical protein KR032_009354, partial [Drosophila birchii]